LNKNEKANDSSNGILHQCNPATLPSEFIIDASMVEKLIETIQGNFPIGGLRKDPTEEFCCILIHLIDDQVMQASTEISIIVRTGFRTNVERGGPGEQQST
jgi:hypothetical protein